MRGVYFGSNPIVGEIINKTVKIDKIIIESESFNKQIIDFAHFINADLVSVVKVDQLMEFENIGDIAVSYGFGMKFTKDVIDKLKLLNNKKLLVVAK